MTFEAGWNAAIEKAAAKVDNLKAHLNMEEFLLVLRDKPKAAEIAKAVCSILDANAAAIRSLTLPSDLVAVPKFKIGDRVEKIKGSSWRGRIVGTYSTELTKEGYAVESENEPGSVQIYPADALRAMLAAHKEGHT